MQVHRHVHPRAPAHPHMHKTMRKCTKRPETVLKKVCKDWGKEEQEEQEQRIGNCFSLPFLDLTRIINLYKQVTIEDLYHKEEKFIWNAAFLVLSLHIKAHNDTHVIPLE